MSKEETDLATHVEICSLRYQGIEQKFVALELRISKVETEINSLKAQMQAGFSDIKLLLEKQSNSRQTAMITTIGSIVVAVIAVIGYLVTKH